MHTKLEKYKNPLHSSELLNTYVNYYEGTLKRQGQAGEDFARARSHSETGKSQQCRGNLAYSGELTEHPEIL